MKIGLINPNSNRQTMDMMVDIARRAVPAATVDGFTATTGPMMIEDCAALDASSAEVVRIGHALVDFDGLIVSAFGDPGAQVLGAGLSIPVVGIGSAAARFANTKEAPFAVVTTTPALVRRIDQLMQAAAPDVPYLGTFVTNGDAASLMSRAQDLDLALLGQIMRASSAGAAQAIIGGGPLGAAAERLASQSPIELINPIKAATAEICSILNSGRGYQL